MGIESPTKDVVVGVSSLEYAGSETIYNAIDSLGHRLTIIVCGIFVFTYVIAPSLVRIWTVGELYVIGPFSIKDVNPIVEGTPSTLKQS